MPEYFLFKAWKLKQHPFSDPFLNGVDYINFLDENGYFRIFFTAMNVNLLCLLCLIVWGDNSIIDVRIEKWKRTKTDAGN